MENCFVKTYKMTVTDDSIEYFDALQFNIDWGNMSDKRTLLFNNSVIRLGGVGVKVVILNNGEIKNSRAQAGTGVQEFVIPSNWTSIESKTIYPIDSSKRTELLLFGLSKISSVYFVDSDIIVCMKNPLRLRECVNLLPYERTAGVKVLPIFPPYESFGDVDVSDYVSGYAHKEDVTEYRGFAGAVEGFSARSISGTLAYSGYLNLKSVNRSCCIDYGNIDSFADLTAMTSLAVGYSGSNRGVEGYITSLAKLTSLTTINLNNSKVQGTIEDFISAQYDNGRKSASRIWVLSSYVTYQGVAIGSTGKYVSWDDGGSEPTNITVTAS